MLYKFILYRDIVNFLLIFVGRGGDGFFFFDLVFFVRYVLVELL